MKVLFITSNRLGDGVLSTGLLHYITQTWPEAKITIACGFLPATVFEGVPGLEDVVILKKKSWHRHWLDLWKRSVTTRWDMVVDLRNSAVSRLIFAKKRYIYGPHVDRNLHKVEQNAAVMGLDKKDAPAPYLWLSDKQRERAEKLVPEDGPVLAIGPTANWTGKTWPYERFIDVIERLTSPGGVMKGARVAVFAAPGEEEDAFKVLNAIPKDRQIDMIARGNPGTAAAALARCDFYIGNDSGLMHCAAAVGIPVLGLFGPSWPYLYRPWGDHTAYVSTPKTFAELTDFEGYDPKTVGTLMEGLSVDVVIEAAEALYKRTKKGR